MIDPCANITHYLKSSTRPAWEVLSPSHLLSPGCACREKSGPELEPRWFPASASGPEPDSSLLGTDMQYICLASQKVSDVWGTQSPVKPLSVFRTDITGWEWKKFAISTRCCCWNVSFQNSTMWQITSEREKRIEGPPIWNELSRGTWTNIQWECAPKKELTKY